MILKITMSYLFIYMCSPYLTNLQGEGNPPVTEAKANAAGLSQGHCSR